MKRPSSILVLVVLALLSSPFLLVSGVDLDKGNEELKAALDRAAVLAFQKGMWTATLGQEEGVNLPFVCGDWRTLGLYPQPKVDEITPGGALSDVLERQVINAAYINTEIKLTKYDGTNFTAINTKTPGTVTGAFSDWHHLLVNELSAMYNTAITVNYVIRDTPTMALEAVMSGAAHLAITPFRTDLTYNGLPRTWRFLSGCPDNGLTTGYLYQPEHYQRFNSYAEILETTGHSIGALNTNCNVYKMTFIEANVECVDNATALEEGLDTGRFDVVSENVDDSVVVPGSLPTTAFGSFYRRDNPCSAPVPAASSAEKLGVLWSSLFVLVVVGWLVVVL